MASLGRLGRWLLRMTVHGMVPVIGGCAEALVRHYAGPGSTGLGKGVGDGLERGLNYFGLKIIGKWIEELPQESTAEQTIAFQELGQASPQEIRDEAKQLLEEIHLEYAEADLNLALDYLTAIPQAIGRSLVADLHTGTKSLAKPVNPSQPQSLLQLLPADIPPYPSHGNLAGTPYVLEELVGMGGFGAVYRASAQSLQYLNFAIKFCLDRSVADALQNERANLERLIEAGSHAWSDRIIRLFGHGLDHQTPFLVYEYVPGGDLCQRLQAYASQNLLPTHDVVLGWIKEIVQGLAFAHSRGLVHRDLKPANILVHNNHLKLADFGIGGVVAGQAIEKSQIGTLTPQSLPFAEQVSLYRGAGTPLYMSPEQRRGDAPDPKHDLYSLGVMWYQLLVADVSRELHPGWADELKEEYHALPSHIEAIRTCVGLFRKRPNDGTALLNLLNGLTEPPPMPARQAPKSQTKPKEFVPPPPPPKEELEFVPPTPATPPPMPVTLPTPTAPKVEPPPILRLPTPTPIPATPPPAPIRPLNDSKASKSKPKPEPELEPLPVSGVALGIILPASGWVFADSEIVVHFDGIYLGSGSIKTGINLKTSTTKGRHDLMCKVTVAGFPRQTDIPLNLAEEGFYDVDLVFNRMLGKLYLERVTKQA